MKLYIYRKNKSLKVFLLVNSVLLFTLLFSALIIHKYSKFYNNENLTRFNKTNLKHVHTEAGLLGKLNSHFFSLNSNDFL